MSAGLYTFFTWLSAGPLKLWGPRTWPSWPVPLSGPGAYYLKVVEDTPIHSASEMKPDESSFQQYITYGDIRRVSPPARALSVEPSCR